MACKRGATSELNHDNWNCEDEPEEAGTFSTASEEVLKTRIVKTAKRRLPANDGTTKSAFGSFAGFSTVSAAEALPFTFLSKTETSSAIPTVGICDKLTPVSNGSFQTPRNGSLFGSSSPCNSSVLKQVDETTQVQRSKKNKEPKTESKNMFKQSSDYYAKLKGLNESVASWIKTHVDANPFCILTPIFKDYDKHLSSIEAKHGNNGIETSDKERMSPESRMDIKNNAEKKADLAFQPSSSGGTLGSGMSLPVQTNKSSAGSIFGKLEETSIFGNKNSESMSLQDTTKETGNSQKLEPNAPSFTTNTKTFGFGQSLSSGTSTSFSFGESKPFSFGSSVIASHNSENKERVEQDEEDEETPKADVKPVTEDGAIFEKRCKLFVKKDGVFGDRGVGVLFLKPIPSGKTQLIVRADNSLGNLLLNTLLTDSIPIKRMNKNTVMLMCLPLPDSLPPPTAVLLRVKTSEDADSLNEALENNKK